MKIIDTTLRDGAQAPGLSFSISEKLKICSMLNRLGIEEVESGIPAMGLEEVQSLLAIDRAGFNFTQLVWCRAKKQDIQAVPSINKMHIHISVSCSEIHEKSMNVSFEKSLKDLPTLIKMALKKTAFVSIGAQDAGRAPIQRVIQLAQIALEAGASRLRIADTVGSLSPLQVHHLIQKVQSQCTIPLEFHAHNDLGMATANSITALQSGCCSVSSTLLGIGERAGNAKTEELAVALFMQGKKYNIKPLRSICKNFAQMIRYPVPHNSPITGKHINTHESGIHTNALLKDTQAYQALPCEALNIPQNLVFGTHSGINALKKTLLKATEDKSSQSAHMQQFLQAIKQDTAQKKQYYTQEQIQTMWNHQNI
jgi:homocitrate synthase NifV